jgi:succinyl-CoA synthetase beta subunit
MDLLEYQAKELFRGMGIPVLPSQRINSPADIKALTIPYPVVLKSQVYMGGRARMGGVKFVANTIDAIAAAQTIFNLPIMGEYPQVLLAEAKYNATREFYLAVVLNRSLRRPVLLGSQQGGVDVQTASAQMQHVIVDQDFSAYYARRLALKMGLQGDLIGAVSTIIEKMVVLFIQKDLDLVEINPLGISPDGAVMALDGKITVNDAAIARHPDLANWMPATPPPQSSPGPMLLDPEGKIGVLCNGTGLTLAALDLLSLVGGHVASVMNIGPATRCDASRATLRDHITKALAEMVRPPQTRVLLLNLMSGMVEWEDLVQCVQPYLQRPLGQPADSADNPVAPSPLPGPHWVIRLATGSVTTVANALVNPSPDGVVNPLPDAFVNDPRVHIIADLDAAIAKAVALSHVAPVPLGDPLPVSIEPS